MLHNLDRRGSYISGHMENVWIELGVIDGRMGDAYHNWVIEGRMGDVCGTYVCVRSGQIRGS